jgi:hypothetical protein
VPQETVKVEESCSSQKRVLPSDALAAVTGLPTGAGGGDKGEKISDESYRRLGILDQHYSDYCSNCCFQRAHDKNSFGLGTAVVSKK